MMKRLPDARRWCPDCRVAAMEHFTKTDRLYNKEERKEMLIHVGGRLFKNVFSKAGK